MRACFLYLQLQYKQTHLYFFALIIYVKNLLLIHIQIVNTKLVSDVNIQITCSTKQLFKTKVSEYDFDVKCLYQLYQTKSDEFLFLFLFTGHKANQYISIVLAFSSSLPDQFRYGFGQLVYGTFVDACCNTLLLSLVFMRTFLVLR